MKQQLILVLKIVILFVATPQTFRIQTTGSIGAWSLNNNRQTDTPMSRNFIAVAAGITSVYIAEYCGFVFLRRR